MKKLVSFILALTLSIVAFCQPVRHVVLISIDGFRPVMYLDKTWPAPNLQWLMSRGVYADHLKSVFPAYTHPSHAAMTTGALPARSGIVYNQPKGSRGEWNWYYNYIKAPTIWAACKRAGLNTAAIMWPNTVDGDITWNVSEIWDKDHPADRVTEVRRHARPLGIYEDLERYATGALDTGSMNDDYFSLDENAGRMAAWIFKTYKPNLLALHFACVDGAQHEFGTSHDSVRLALEANDRAIGEILEAVERSGMKDSTAIIIIGDHGFADIHEAFRPNILIQDIHARFIAAGGSAFLYRTPGIDEPSNAELVRQVRERLEQLPPDKRKEFRIIDRPELDRMGADSEAIMALAADPKTGLVFSGAVTKAKVADNGPGTLIQQNPLDGVFIPVHGGHHGYDPNDPAMYTGFIAYGAGIAKGKNITSLSEPDIAALLAALLGIDFKTPDGKLVPGIMVNH